jgi:hypothetical protein
MSKKIKVLFLSLFVLLGVTTVLSAKEKKTIIGNTYLVKKVNGQSIDMGDVLQMFISFEEDELVMTIVANGEEQSQTEEISYDAKNQILTEYTEEGEMESTIEFDGDDVTMTSADGTVMILKLQK